MDSTHQNSIMVSAIPADLGWTCLVLHVCNLHMRISKHFSRNFEALDNADAAVELYIDL